MVRTIKALHLYNMLKNHIHGFSNCKGCRFNIYHDIGYLSDCLIFNKDIHDWERLPICREIFDIYLSGEEMGWPHKQVLTEKKMEDRNEKEN